MRNESLRDPSNNALRKDVKENAELNIKTFQKGLYDRVINTIFKSINFLSVVKRKSGKETENGDHLNDDEEEKQEKVEKENFLKWSFTKYSKVISALKEHKELADSLPKLEELSSILEDVNSLRKQSKDLDFKLKCLLDLIQGC